jgi:hypothetical protein
MTHWRSYGRVIAACTYLLLFCSVSKIHGQISDFPKAKVTIYQEHGHLSFEFFVEKNSGVGLRKVPARIFLLIVHDPESKEIVWRIETSQEKNMVPRMTYGVIPDGFSQIIPEVGSAPVLKSGRKYVVIGDGEGLGITPFVVQEN